MRWVVMREFVCKKSYMGARVFEDAYVRICIEDVQGGVVIGRVCVRV